MINVTCAKPAAALIGLLLSGVAGAADWYVDGINGNNSNRGTLASPIKDVWWAWNRAAPGDRILLLPTTTYGPLYFSGKAGAVGKPITIRGTGSSSAMTKVSGKGRSYGIMLHGVSHVNVENLDITAPGHGSNAGWSGIYSKDTNNIRITDNYVHDSGCSGIQTENADYHVIMSNRVARNAMVVWNRVFCSGISNHENLDIDTNTGTKFWILNNHIYGNTNYSPTSTYTGTNSDGNGIIIDDTRRTQTDYRAYKGKTMVRNNVIYNNGGRGIAIFYSDNVDVISNTLFYNNQDPKEGSWRPGEIGITFSGGVNVWHNIMYSDGKYGSQHTGTHVGIQIMDNTKGRPINVDHNILFNPQANATLARYTRNNTVPLTYGAGNKFVDPKFTKASTDPLVALFTVTSASPALGFPVPTGRFATRDVMWVERGVKPTAGAYQLPR